MARQASWFAGHWFALCLAALIPLSYLWVDQPVAFYVHDHALDHHRWLITLTHLADLSECLALACAVVTIGALAFSRPLPGRARWAGGLSLSVGMAYAIKGGLKIVFGRAWPQTWTQHNLSLIQNHVYGFLWFQTSAAYHSFPSGHTSVVCAALGVLWVGAPRWRVLYVFLGCAVAIGLIGMNYHFVSDVLAGALLGSLCARACVALVLQRRQIA